jgi:hypothetical protein
MEFWSKTLQEEKECREIYIVIKEENPPTRILYQVKLFFQVKGKLFSHNQKEFIISLLPL